jgi:hypothetical protein
MGSTQTGYAGAIQLWGHAMNSDVYGRGFKENADQIAKRKNL